MHHRELKNNQNNPASMNRSHQTGSGLAHLRARFGPGLIFAAAAVGTSHIVQSTRAGAGFGLTLGLLILLVCLLKYPLFRFAADYAAATGESLVRGYGRRGRLLVLVMFITSAIEGGGRHGRGQPGQCLYRPVDLRHQLRSGAHRHRPAAGNGVGRDNRALSGHRVDHRHSGGAVQRADPDHHPCQPARLRRCRCLRVPSVPAHQRELVVCHRPFRLDAHRQHGRHHARRLDPGETQRQWPQRQRGPFRLQSRLSGQRAAGVVLSYSSAQRCCMAVAKPCPAHQVRS